MKAYKYNKNIISAYGQEFMKLLRVNDFADDCAVYFNEKRYRWTLVNYNSEFKTHMVQGWATDSDKRYHPMQYNEYAPEKNIISFTTEGTLYDYLDQFGVPEWMEKFASERHLSVERIEGWFWSFVPEYEGGNYNDWETDNFNKEGLPRIELNDYKDYTDNDLDMPFFLIQNFWETWMTERVDTTGKMVKNAGINFTYKDKKYKMIPSPKMRGEIPLINTNYKIVRYLMLLGCTDVKYDSGERVF